MSSNEYNNQSEEITTDYTAETLLNSINLNEIDLPSNFHELLGDASRFLTNAIEDFSDAVVQVKSVSSEIAQSSVWSKAIVVDAVNNIMGEKISDYMDLSSVNGEKTSFIDYTDDVLTRYYTCSEDYTIYALGVENLVSSVLKELKENDYDTYQTVVEYMKKNNINSLKAFTDDVNIGNSIKVFMERCGANISSAPGIVAFNIIKTKGLSTLFSTDYKDILREGLKNFLSGKQGGKIPAVGKSLVSGLGVAGAFFLLGVGKDAITGNFSWENVAVRGSRAAVTAISGAAGTAVTSALSGTAVGSVAGPIGMAVGALVAVIGNIVIDSILHEIHYASNDLPKEYTPISLSDIKQQMTKKGYELGVPKIGDMTIYEAVNYTTREVENNEVINYLTEAFGGYSTWPQEKLERYDEIAYYSMSIGYRASDYLDLTPEEAAFADTIELLYNPEYHYQSQVEWEVYEYLEEIIIDRNDW